MGFLLAPLPASEDRRKPITVARSEGDAELCEGIGPTLAFSA